MMKQQMKLNKQSTDKMHYFAVGTCFGLFVSMLLGCSYPITKPEPIVPAQSYMEYMIAHGYVYRTNVVVTNEIWRAK